jgi:ATP-dependent RNA helicase RhlE
MPHEGRLETGPSGLESISTNMTSTFTDLGVAEPLLRALAVEGYLAPTPIQARAIPHLLAGRDLLGIAQTGSGKTASFALPILQRLAANPRKAGPKRMRALVLSPTRELAAQIAGSFKAYGRNLKLSHATVYGGVGQGPQVSALARGLDILIATPGRLLDLMQQGHARLDEVETFVLDEADRMLDMGFLPAIRRIVAAVPKKRQTLFFSATMPSDIAHLVRDILSDPVRAEVAPTATTVETVEQRVYHIDSDAKRELLAKVLEDPELKRAIVFTRTKHGANRLAQQLERGGHRVVAIHGNKSQSQRERALSDLRSGRARVMVATDVAARGIDIDGVTHVVNYEMPNLPESYVHRIGRTARAGATGIALSFCAGDERTYLRDIERLIGRQLSVIDDHGFAVPPARSHDAPPHGRKAGGGRRGGPGGHNGHNGHGGFRGRRRQGR